jgi:hypothetical protein
VKASVGIGAATALALAALIPGNQASVQHPSRTAHHQAAAAPVHAQLTAYTARSGRSHRAHHRVSHRTHHRVSHRTHYGPRLATTLGSFAQCVIQRESGGNSQVMNSTGHYGLYQFAYGTWVAYGGSPSAFGHASAAQQDQVFANAMATPGGASNWRSYDGC